MQGNECRLRIAILIGKRSESLVKLRELLLQLSLAVLQDGADLLRLLPGAVNFLQVALLCGGTALLGALLSCCLFR